MPAPRDYEVNFPDLPPFPDDVPTAPIERLSLQALLDGTASETARLVSSSCDTGFFYLDLRGARGASVSAGSAPAIEGDAYLATAASLFAAAGPIFAVPESEKHELDFAARGSYYGFKPLGAGVTDARGTRDANEFYNTSKDDLLEQAPREPAPAAAEPARPLMAEYVRRSHAIVQLLLQRLEEGLEWTGGSLTSIHRLGRPSGDQVRLVRAPAPADAEAARAAEAEQARRDPRAALGAHTDYGSVTLLHNRLGGLQILPQGRAYSGRGDETGWEYVRPLPGHCVVNLGDAMVKLSAGRLISGLHRVVRPPGQQAPLERLSLVYFSRPEDDVVLRALVGGGGDDDEGITAKEWTLRRALGRRGVDKFQDAEGTETARRVSAVS